MSITYAYAGELVKTEKTPDGDLLVYGKATGPDLDLDEQICDPKWLKTAMPQWAEWANVREQHTAIAAGVGVETVEQGDDWFVKTLVTDKGTAHKVETGTLKGYSVGIRGARVVKDAKAPGGRIVGGTIVELSLVDRPCNPTAKMAICKMAGDSLRPVDEAGDPLGDDPSSFGLGEDVVPEPEQVETPAEVESEKVAATQVAKAVTVTPSVEMSEDAPSPALVKAISEQISRPKRRATESGLMSVRAYKAAVAVVTKTLAGDLTKMIDEGPDIAGAWAAIGQICDLIINEATELKGGRMEEKHDIEILIQAICCLACFLDREAMEQAGAYGPGEPDEDDMSYVQLMAGAVVGKQIRAKQRQQMAKEGVAMPNGDFPIPDEGHLRSAVGRLGNYTGDKAAAKKHIIARAKALNLVKLLPDDWGVAGASADKKTPEPDTAKAPTAASAVDIPEIVKQAVAEATKSHEAELKALRDELAKVAATPIPGGPVLIAPPNQRHTPDTATKAARYRAIADQTSDPSVRSAYLALADRETAATSAN